MFDALNTLLINPLSSELILAVASSMAFVYGFVSGVNTH